MPSSDCLSKAKNVTFILSIAMSFLLVLYTFYIRLMNSENLVLVIFAQFIIILLFILYRRTSDPTPQVPLFSFPSLSNSTQTHTRLFSFPSFSSHESQLANSDTSLHEQVVARPQLENDYLQIDWRATSEWASFGRTEALERASTVSGEEEVIKMVVHELPHVDQGNLGDESMDETWRSIIARGEAKPVGLFKSKKSLEKVHDMNESATLKRKVKKKKKEGETSYEEETSGWRQRDIYEIKEPATPRRKEKSKKKEGETSLEKETNGWRQRDAIMMSNAEISRLSDVLIKRQHNRLKIEREESDQRRLVLV